MVLTDMVNASRHTAPGTSSLSDTFVRLYLYYNPVSPHAILTNITPSSRRKSNLHGVLQLPIYRKAQTSSQSTFMENWQKNAFLKCRVS